MIAVDSSVAIDYINGVTSKHTDALYKALLSESVWMPPVVVTELYGIKSAPNEHWRMFVYNIPLLETDDGYWQRAGKIRQAILQKKRKAKLGDALIAQSCIDHDVPLLTRDPDFAHYAEHCALTLAIAS